MNNAHSYSFQISPVLPTLSSVKAAGGIEILRKFGKKKSALHALFSGWVAGTYLNLSHPGVGPVTGPTPDSLEGIQEICNHSGLYHQPGTPSWNQLSVKELRV